MLLADQRDVECCLSFAAFVGAVLLVVWVGRWRARLARGEPPDARPYRKLKAFIRALRRARHDPAMRERAARLSFEGVLPTGRRARITMPTPDEAHFAVSVHAGTPALSVRLRAALRTRRRSLRTGDADFDRCFLVEAEDPERGREALGRRLRDAIDDAFQRFGAEQLLLKDEELRVRILAAHLPLERWPALLEHLDAAAAMFDTRQLTVRVLEGEHPVVCDAQGRARCAYCRDVMSVDQPDLVACERCHTVVHDGCWAEHGSCPVLGCDGAAREPAREKA